MTRRLKQVNHLIRREISELLRRSVKEPRIIGIITVTEVVISHDMTQAKVFISVMGSEEEKTETFKGLAAASGFLRRELGSCLSLRHIPELIFERDDSIERGERLLQMIEKVATGSDPDDQQQI